MRITKRRALVLLGLITVLPLVLFYPFYGHAPCRVSTRVLALKSGTELLDANGQRLGYMDPTRDRYVPLSALPAYVPTAFTAVEDRRLYAWYHRGVDPVGTVAAAVNNLRPGDGSRRGASTIPMQLARALCADRMPQDHSWSGKLAEAGLGTYLTARFGKRQVVELYLNSVYLGRNRKGIDAAARSYFAKAATQLTAADAAELAHLVANPRDRDPAQNDVRARRAAITNVFDKMRRLDPSFTVTKKRLTPSRARMAVATPPMYRGYVSRVRDGFATCQPSVNCPTSVQTFLDAGLQRAADRELTSLVRRLQGPDRPRRKADTTARREVAGIFVAMRVSTGEIVSYTGRHGRTAGGADLLRIGRIQPASAIKPLLLAAALDDGNMYTDETLGELMGSHCTDPKVHEYLATLSGYDAPDRTIAEAMLRSDNVLGACLMAGLSTRARQRLVAAGILRTVHATPADGLGLQTVAPLDLLTAYAALRARDRALMPRFSGYDASGTAAPLMSPMSADATYSMLQDVARHGTAWRAGSVLSDDYALAGKTGTAGKGRELVFVGFARDLVALLWVGVVSGPGAVSTKHASDVVVAPWARILRAYAPRDAVPETFERGSAREVEFDAEDLQRWIGRIARRVERQTL
ncbi:MAG: transglycosylase domain-containing protein [Gemmatimonadaceae bacterium]|nr:transglycosylase domain-containing protein [Gemmatimonadaceae bacterium]